MENQAKPEEDISTIEQLSEFVSDLYYADVWHVKRGFRLSQTNSIVVSNHLLEEAVELQAEIYSNDRKAQIEEAADVLINFLHVLQLTGISVPVVVRMARDKLTKTFTSDPSQITAKTPGLTRSGR